ncbi:MAG: hypothetical protein IKU36_03190 [Bacteroidales bacterium]|nr:hypothetical protein [Bacteroidales bacterium]
MKRLLSVTLMLMLSVFAVAGQELSDDVRKIYDACVALRTAAEAGSAPQMREANMRLKEVRSAYFGTLRQVSGEKVSMNGHMVFDYEFVDSLLVNRKVYSFAQKYLDRTARRGASSSSTVFMKTCCVKAEDSVKYSFKAQDKQELALVTEPGGLVNVKVYDSRNDIWHNDDDGLNTGKSAHVRVFDIPEGMTDIVVEVINKTDKDRSFVIISN